MSNKVIGVDFSGRGVSLALVTFDKGEYRTHVCRQAASADADPWDGLAEALEGLRREADPRDAVCVAALPDEWVHQRVVTMPFADRKKIAKVLAYELEPLLPLAVDDMIVDFQPLGASRTMENGHDFLAAAVDGTRLQAFIGRMNELGLEPEIITCRGLAVSSVLAAGGGTGLFIDGQETRLTAAAYTEGRLRFTRTVAVGQADREGPRALAEALRHLLLADEERQPTAFRPEKVYIGAHLGSLDGLAQAVAAVPEIAAVRPEITSLAAALPRQAGVGTGDAAFCLALLKGLRSIVINFRKDRFAVTGKWRQYSDILIKTGLMAALVVIIGLGGFFYDLRKYRRQIAALDTRITGIFNESFPGVPLIDDPLAQMRLELDRLKGKNSLPSEMGRKAWCIDILNDISRLVPANGEVVIERLMIGPDDVTLSGSTDSFNAVDTLKSEFGKSALFGKIDISSATMSKVDKRVSFKIRLELL